MNIDIKNNKIKYLLIILFILIIISLIINLFVFNPANDERIINNTNSEMSSITSYEVTKETFIYDSNDLISSTEKTSEVNILEDKYISNIETIERDETHNNIIYKNNDDYYIINENNVINHISETDTTIQPIGYENSFNINNKYNAKSNLIRNGYTLESKIKENESIKNASSWYILDELFNQNYDYGNIEIKIREDYKIDEINIEWMNGDRRTEINYKFSNYNTDLDIMKPNNVTERNNIEESTPSINLNADFSINHNDDNIEINLNNYSDDVDNISIRSFKMGETTFNPEPNKTIILTEGVEYDYTDNISIGIKSDYGNYLEIESINHNMN